MIVVATNGKKKYIMSWSMKRHGQEIKQDRTTEKFLISDDVFLNS